MALRPGATGMFLWAVDEGVTRRKGTAGRLMTTAWVAVGRIARGSPGDPEDGCAPGPVPPWRGPVPPPGRGTDPPRACTPGRAGVPERPGCPERTPAPGRLAGGTEPG